jgi:hypothetical protein
MGLMALIVTVLFFHWKERREINEACDQALNSAWELTVMRAKEKQQ